MKKKIKIQNFIPTISFLPFITLLLSNPRERISIFNSLSSGAISGIFISTGIIYLINLVYRVIYLKKKEKPLIWILLFSFVWNLIHLLSGIFLLIFVIGLTSINNSSRYSYYILLSIVLILLTTMNFEVRAYNNSSKLNTKELLSETTRESKFNILALHIFPAVILFIMLTSKTYGIEELITGVGLLTWNAVFLLFIRPKLHILLNNE